MQLTINGFDVEVTRYQPATDDRNTGDALGGFGDWEQGEQEIIEFDVYDEDGEFLFSHNDTSTPWINKGITDGIREAMSHAH